MTTVRQQLLLLTFVFTFTSTCFAQSQKEDIKSLDWLIGKWSISGGEQDSDGSFFKETGLRHCEYVSKGRMIRCELSLITEESGGRYKDKWSSRVIISYLSYDSEKNQFLIRTLFPNRTHTHNFGVKNDSTFEGKWVLENHPLGGDMDVTFRYEMIDENTYHHIEFLKSRTSGFQEDFKLIGRRIE